MNRRRRRGVAVTSAESGIFDKPPGCTTTERCGDSRLRRGQLDGDGRELVSLAASPGAERDVLQYTEGVRGDPTGCLSTDGLAP